MTAAEFLDNPATDGGPYTYAIWAGNPLGGEGSTYQVGNFTVHYTEEAIYMNITNNYFWGSGDEQVKVPVFPR